MRRERLAAAVGILTAATLALSACAGPENGTSPPTSRPASSKADRPTSSTPAGTKPRLVPGPVPTNLVPPGSGDFARHTAESDAETKAAAMRWVVLAKAGIIGDLGPVVINSTGVLLYRFDEDKHKPSKSTCTGACTKTWIPVLIAPNGTIYLTDIRKSAVGTVEREDGTLQVTLGGWPTYRHVEDEEMGDRNGQGVDDAWFGVRPDGGKATPESSGANISIVLYPEKDLAGTGLQTSGPGCQTLSKPGVASSLKVYGGPAAIWSREDCTGDSAPVRGEVRDLTTIAFDNKIASVEFGSSRK